MLSPGIGGCLRALGEDLRVRLASATGRLAHETMAYGVAAGARFSAGPSNAGYGKGDVELPVQRAFSEILSGGDVLFDVGANVGFFTIIGARLVGARGHVYAFEPVPSNAALVRHNARLNGFGNVTVFEKAVGESTRKGELLLARYSGGAALEVAGKPPDFAGSMAVEVVALDDCVEQQLLPVPSVVKIDVEGAEIQVLRGLERILRKHRPRLIYELDGADKASVDLKHEECRGFLAALRYEMFELPVSYPGNPWIVRHIVAHPAE